MKALQADWNAAQSLGNSSFTQGDITNSLKAAQDQINSTQSAFKSITSQANGFDSNAKQIYQQADAFANKNGC